ncbi:MAG: glycosyl transferase family 1 [Saprospiraceae bacterium]|nr:MAG: glycosyl transferase family 1 [Saprospiraceae bacterium]
MYGGAVALTDAFAALDFDPDLILATDMLDLTTFLALNRTRVRDIPVALYFHENQITYPWSPDDQDIHLNRNRQYGFINYASALAADQVFFNSAFHRNAFLGALPNFLKAFPDRKGLHHVKSIRQKSKVLPLGMDLQVLQSSGLCNSSGEAVLLWNHRWEYDKDPDTFFTLLFRLKAEKVPFRLIVTGASFRQEPPIFAQAKKELRKNILHFGYATSRTAYRNLLWQADILPVTSRQDFFGGSIVEAIYCQCYPLLPHRLAYPEHIPKALHQQHLYQETEELYQRLKALILNINQTREATNCQNFVSQYDWSILAPQYDAQFRAIQVIHP